MEIKLENIIEKIKKDGVEEAHKTSEEIIEKARQEAVSIINNADKEAASIIEKAKQKTQQFQKNAKLSLKQSARDSELLLKERITVIFDKVFKKEVSSTLSPDFIKELILKIVKNWTDNKDTEIIVNEKDKAKLEDLLFSNLKTEVKNSITIKISPDISGGFRIGLKGENVYYDFSENSITDMLKMFLNPKLKEILDIGNG